MDRTRVSAGVDGLDRVLDGGLIAQRSYMIRGPAGAGKTLVCLHFLTAGVAADESALFVNLEQDVDDLKTDAETLGMPVDDIEFVDLSPSANVFVDDASYDVFTAADVEQEGMTEEIVDAVERVGPDRVVVDPLTQLRYLTSDEYQFRKQVVGLMRYLTEAGATVLFTTQETSATPTEELQFITDGTVQLEQRAAGRFVSVPKFRGSGTRNGNHAYRIDGDGVHVFPELSPRSDQTVETPEGTLSSGVPEVDALLNGGLERATVNIISGPTGVGKTTLGTQFANAAAERGERTVVYLFEETEHTFKQRSRAVNIPVDEMIQRGTLHVEEVEGLEITPQEFGHRVRTEVEENEPGIVMLDGVAGFRITAGEDTARTVRRLHALGRHLKGAGVTTLLIDETSSVTGEFTATDENISYLADSLVFLRHVELNGKLQKVIGVLKKRTSDFERTLRQFEITEAGVRVGEPITGLRGVLSGTPEVVDDGPGENADDSEY